MLRAQELCESRGGRPGLPVPNKFDGFCGRKAAVKTKRSDPQKTGKSKPIATTDQNNILRWWRPHQCKATCSFNSCGPGEYVQPQRQCPENYQLLKPVVRPSMRAQLYTSLLRPLMGSVSAIARPCVQVQCFFIPELGQLSNVSKHGAKRPHKS